MQDVIANLRLLNEPVPSPLTRPTLDDVARVEGILKRKLPDDFVALQLGAGDVVYGHYEPTTLAPDSGHTYIVQVAQDAWQSGVPKSHLPICEDNGDYFCLTEDGKVVYWSHDGVSIESWPSLECWVQEVWLGKDAA